MSVSPWDDFLHPRNPLIPLAIADRSTGFEAKLFQTMNNRARRQVEANAWSMEDM